ncbi:MAG: ATP synthase F0 subunit B [Bryobacteraceae bacterium]|jgi:F-type H+-transporting ATPase subunit b
MESTLQALGGILLKAIPTIVLLLVVFVYLRWMFFGPLEKILAQRRDASSGAIRSAEAILAKAEQTAADIEARLRKARDEMYQEQEAARREWTTAQAGQLDQARHQSHELVRQAREQLAAETESAKRELAATADSLAEQIARSFLGRNAA